MSIIRKETIIANNKLLIPALATLGVVGTIATVSAATNVANALTSASSSIGSTSTSTQNDTSTQRPPVFDESKGGHTANGKTETLLTGTDLEKATAAATAKVSGATVLRAETEADGKGTYEVHMRKSDGSHTTVYLDTNFTVTSTEDGPNGPGPRGPRPPRDSSITADSSQQN